MLKLYRIKVKYNVNLNRIIKVLKNCKEIKEIRETNSYPQYNYIMVVSSAADWWIKALSADIEYIEHYEFTEMIKNS